MRKMFPGLVVVVGARMAAGSQGMQMQMALQVRTEFVHQVADQDFAHLLMAELDSLHQRTELVVGIPVGGDHARAVGAGKLRYVELEPSVLAIGGEGHLQGVGTAPQRAVTLAAT